MRNKHLETTYKCCTSDADGIIRQWALPDQSEDHNCNPYKSQLYTLYFRGMMHKTCFSIKHNRLVPKDDNNLFGSVMVGKWNDQHSFRPLTLKGMDGKYKLYLWRQTTSKFPISLKFNQEGRLRPNLKESKSSTFTRRRERTEGKKQHFYNSKLTYLLRQETDHIILRTLPWAAFHDGERRQSVQTSLRARQ
jgi:hypothetical protein